MKPLSLHRPPAYVFYATGVAAAVFGGVALFLWQSGAQPFYSIRPVPYTTAFGLLLYGLAAAALAFRRHAIANILAAALIAVAGVRLIEYLATSELQNFFSHSDVSGEPRGAGTLTALSFVLLGAALVTLARKSRGKPALIAASLIATAVLAISLTTLVGSMSTYYPVHDALVLAGVKIPAALLFLALSAGLIVFVFFARAEHGISIARWAPLAVWLGVFVGALQLWQALIFWEERQTGQDVVWTATTINSNLRAKLKEQIAILDRLAARWEIFEPGENEWRADVRATLKNSYFSGVAWFDRSLRLRWSSSSGAGRVQPAPVKEASFSKFTVLDSGEIGIHVELPVFHEEIFDGVITGALPMRALLRETLLGGQGDFSLALIADGGEVISLNEENATLIRRWGVEQPFLLGQVEWTLRVAPTAEYLEAARARLPQVLLVSGFAAAVLLAVAVFFYQSARAHAADLAIANRRLAHESEDRRQASLALARSEARVSEIMQQAQDAIISYDAGHKITRFNRAAEKIFGVSAAETLGTPVSRLLPGEFKSQGPREMTAARCDGTAFVAEVSISRTGAGNEAVYTAVLRDISERKKAQLDIERSRKQLRALSAHLQTVREEEKIALAKQLHDELGTKLTALKLDLGWLKTKLAPEARGKASAMGDALDAALKSMRRMWSALRPSVLDDLGLYATIKWEASEFRKLWRIPVHVRLDSEETEVPPEIALALYRILQEALANIAVHAKATEVSINFRASEDSWWLEVRDDGIGVDESKIGAPDSAGHGLTAMFERARALRGAVTVKGAPGRGTAVIATLPRARCAA